MRKGLQLTLMTVAIALISAQAMAMAPVISDIPSPIIGSQQPATGGSKFVYLDALDTDQLATDDATAAKDLKWTYTGAGGSGTGLHYLINNVAAVSVGSDNLTSPTASKIINKNDLDPAAIGGTGWSDGKANTLTIRNKSLSPIGGGNTIPGTTGIVAAETQVVTFYCSDGDKVSSKTVFFYTDNGGYNRLSSGWRRVMSDAPAATGAQAWTNATDWTGAITRTNPTGGGVCLNTTLTGNVLGSVLSPFPYFTLSANTVYRFTTTMNSSQAAKGAVPLWDIILDNSDPRTAKGLNLYAMDYQVFDDPNQGGANTVTSAGATKTIIWAPPAVATTQWNTQAFTPAHTVSDIQPVLHFRILDYDTVGYGNTKSGAVCITQVTVDSTPIGRAVVSKNMVNLTSLAAVGTTGGNVEVASAISAQHITTSFTGGVLTITPTTTQVANSYDSNGDGVPDMSTSGQQFESTEVHPRTVAGGTDPYAADQWPMHWDSDKIYRMQVSLAAPTTADEAKPWDAYWFGLVTPTYELGQDVYQTSNQKLGSPVTGTPQVYTVYFSSGKETAATNPAFHTIKWYIRFLNHPAIYFPSSQPSTDPTNTGAVALSKVVIDQVDFK